MKTERIIHAFDPVFDSKSRVLVLGTMPSPKSRELGFYYSHPRNRFWPVLAKIFEEKIPETPEEKEKVLAENKEYIINKLTNSNTPIVGAISQFCSCFENGKIAYINVMKNMSVDCDCCAVAEDPCMKDIGILVSLDPIAIDQACIDLVYAATDDPGQAHLLERIESRRGVYTIEASAALGFGSREYELIEVE